ncbi:MAG: DNA-binding domain-containing protein [Burkholderiales bacterium]
MPSLRELQSAFVEGVFGTGNAEAAPVCDAFTAATVRCFAVYRNNTFANFTEALRAVYPVVERLVGDEFFAHAARRFVRDTPSTSGDLHRFGADFPEFLAALPACRGLVYLPDTARLEWLMHEAFHAADHPPLDVQRLAAVPPDRYDALRFCLHPACRLLDSPYPVHRIWQVNQTEAPEPATVHLAEGGVHLLIARPQASVEIELLPPAEFDALAALAEGHSIGDAFECARRRDAGFDAGQFLRRRVAAHTLVDFRPGSPVTEI